MQVGDKGEKTIEIHKVPKSLYYDPIPLDVTREILLRLPAKSLVRFRCVSKLWSSLTTEPDFIKSFTTFSSSRPRLLLSFGKKPTRLFFSLPQHEIPDDKCLSQNDDVSSNYVDLPENYGCTSTFESVHGLISFNEQCNHIVVWNPSISQHVTIPKPDDSRHGPRYLGYDPFGDTYKLLCIPHAAEHRDYGPWVLTLGAEESWRIIEGGTPKHYGLTVSWKCISGVMYYEAYTDINGYMEIRTIMSFNVRFETFKPINFPCCADYFGEHYLLSYNGRLALVCSLDTKLWILEDEKEEKWVCNIDLHLPTRRTDPTGKINYQLNDATVTGEFIYVAVDDKEVHILYYDPKKNSTRSFKFEGSMYKEFEGFGGEACKFNTGCLPNLKGLAYLKSSWMFARCLPNHIENLISLKNITCSKLV
ncbi:hypothetical protein F2Q69_00025711 [Brassica cretica]|uniref:F-box domain-containing protein n=1 Tax=Brassica cretica TaxID=69181 RepID=A0A8S9RTL3_BRACR|nr:hypothetical protein F2Q69_00025711 [Brassica cretica]